MFLSLENNPIIINNKNKVYNSTLFIFYIFHSYLFFNFLTLIDSSLKKGFETGNVKFFFKKFSLQGMKIVLNLHVSFFRDSKTTENAF